MKRNFCNKIILSLLTISLTFITGCCINHGFGIGSVKYEKTVQLSEPLPPGSCFAARTHNGAIAVTGAETANCEVTANIVSRGWSEEDAREIAEKTIVCFERAGNKLVLKINKPRLKGNKSVRVNISATVPNETSLELLTHNGALTIAGINGNVNGGTHNGKVKAKQVCGSTKLNTHNGGILCEEISGDLHLTTHNGAVKAFYSADSPAVCNVSMVTHNGGIVFVSPPGFSAAVQASTHNGSINTELPIMVKGTINKRKLNGIIGSGQGNLNLRTHNGSINIK